MEHKKAPALQYKEFAGKVTGWDDTELTIEHFISTETQDSGGDIMLADGMKIRGKPVVLFQHGLDVKYGSEPIAKVLDIRVGEYDGKKGLIAKTKYFDGSELNPPDATGQRLYMKAKDGTMPNWSIGFNSIADKPTKGGRIVTEWELHEYSQVAVGMNAEATTLSAQAPELKFIIKADDAEPKGIDIVDLGEVDEMICENGECKLVKADGMKPYPNEHACRIAEPSGFTKFRRSNGERDHDGKKYDVIYGMKKDGKWAEQAYRYPKDAWSAEQAAAHCKSKEGRFEAAKAAESTEQKAVPAASHKRAHKALLALHKELMRDLKAHGERDDFVDAGAAPLAKEALEDFTDCATPHAERYIKAVRDMGEADKFGDEADDDVCPDCGKEPCECVGETKGYRKAHNSLRKCLTETIKEIRAGRGDKSKVPAAEAERIMAAHLDKALPHAVEFVKAWYGKCKADAALIEQETKPILKITLPDTATPDPADDANKTARLTIHTPPAQVLKLATPRPEPQQVFKLAVKAQAKPKIQVTPELVQELLKAALAGMDASIRAEIRKAAGRVTN